jgi:hypothetical protein
MLQPIFLCALQLLCPLLILAALAQAQHSSGSARSFPDLGPAAFHPRATVSLTLGATAAPNLENTAGDPNVIVLSETVTGFLSQQT